MIKYIKWFGIGVLFLCLLGCSSAQGQEISSTSTHTVLPTQTQTPQPTATITPEPTPTLALPVSLLTPIPNTDNTLSLANVGDFVQVGLYQGTATYIVRQTPNGEFLFLLDRNGLTKYDASTNQPIAWVRFRSMGNFLQVSDDGRMALVDGGRLIKFDGAQAEVVAIRDHIALQPFYTEYALSPDGSKISIDQMRCLNLCEYILKVATTDTFELLFHDAGMAVHGNSTFSPDGRYFAIVSMPQVAHSTGATEVVGGHVVVWDTDTFTNVGSIRLDYPFRASELVFSPDGSRVAVAQTTGVYVFDWETRERVAGNVKECSSRSLVYVSEQFLVEDSGCGDIVWRVAQGNLYNAVNGDFDTAHHVFSSDGGAEFIPYPHPVAETFPDYSQAYYFGFDQDGDLLFELQHQYTYKNLTCITSLANGRLGCRDTQLESTGGKTLLTRNTLSADGRFFTYSFKNGTINIYESGNTQPIVQLPFTGSMFQLLGIAPDSNVIVFDATGGALPGVVVYDYGAERPLALLKGSVPSIAFSADGRFAAICLRKPSNVFNTGLPVDEMYVFDLVNKATLRKLSIDCSWPSMAFSPDGEYLAIQHKYRDDDVAAGRVIIRTLLLFQDSSERHTIDIEADSDAVVFSPDSSLLIASCGATELCFIDVKTEEVVRRVESQAYIDRMAFSQDGKILAVMSRVSVLSFWAIE